jgi:outer membrane protein OmpA-like peptidoglycan-associated protein
MKKLNKNINSKSWETHASISKDSKTLYFTSERKGGFGGFDIYKSELDENGEWSKAENLGPTINSKYDEDTPYLTRDNQSLYFSSQGHKNMGGFDIFVSEFNQSDWSTPKNVGYPLNTPGNDLFYITQSDGQLAFAPLNDDHLRNVASLTADNWFVVRERAPLISVNLEMFLSDNSDNPIQELFVDTTGIAISNFSNTANTLSFDVESGSYDLLVSALDTDTTQVHIDAIDKGEDYAMSLTANLTLLTVDSFAIEDLLAEEIESQNTNLKANENTNVLASSQGKTAFKEIYFGFDKSVVQKDFMDEVESIYNEWLKDKTRTIAIDGYADPVGNAQYNLKLSQRRADAVKEALLHMGMSEDMIVATGKGETSENVNNYYNRKTVISFVK